ncbi:MAG: hypothetical protein KC502_17785 [Myxococcales bacterium]|nr:hypothetical protein [Myxococcales bacterium]
MLVTLGGGATACTWLLPPHLLRFRADFPGISLRLRQSSTRQVLTAVAAGEVDIGVVTGGHPLPPGVVAEPWQSDKLVVIQRPTSEPRDGRDRNPPWAPLRRQLSLAHRGADRRDPASRHLLGRLQTLDLPMR